MHSSGSYRRRNTQETGDAALDKQDAHDDKGNPEDNSAAGLEPQVRSEGRGLQEGIPRVWGEFREARVNCHKK